jgi:hypothetical protein
MYNPSAIEKSNSQPQAFVDLSDICFLRELCNLITFPADYLQKVYPNCEEWKPVIPHVIISKLRKSSIEFCVLVYSIFFFN